MIRRLARAVGALSTGRLITIGGQVLLVPVFLTHWPPELYGEWLVLNSVAAYLVTLDLGMNAAVANRLTAAHTRRDLAEYRSVQHSATAFYGAVAVIGALIVTALATLTPVTEWLGIRLMPRRDANLVLWFATVSVLGAMPFGLLAGVYRTLGDVATTQWVKNGERLVIFGATAAIIASGAGPVAAGVVPAVTLVVVGALIAARLASRHRGLLPGFADASLRRIRELLRPSLLFFVLTAAVAFVEQAPVIMTASMVGTAAVVLLVTTRTLAGFARQAVGILYVSLYPELTRLHALGETAKLRAVHRWLVCTATAATIALASALLFEGPDVLRVWTRGMLQPDRALLALFLVQAVLQAAWWASGSLPVATNTHGRFVQAYLAASVVGIALAGALVGRIGVMAFPLGLLVAETILCYWPVLTETCRTIGEPPGPFVVEIVWKTIATSVICIVVAGSVHLNSPLEMPWRWLLTGLASAATGGGLLWFLWFREDDREALTARLGRPKQP